MTFIIILLLVLCFNDTQREKPCFTQFSTRIKIEAWLKVRWDPIILKKAAFCSKKETSFGKKCI